MNRIIKILLIDIGISIVIVLLMVASAQLRPTDIPDYPEYLKNARGWEVVSCDNSNPILQADGAAYLQKHGLPSQIGGNYICMDGIPVLPKDCQGEPFVSEQALVAYWTKYQLPIGYMHWVCDQGVPKLDLTEGTGWHLQKWQEFEGVYPTCQDERGRRRPCL